MLHFIEEGHRYTSQEGQPEINWLGATTLIGHLHEKFERDERAAACSKRKPTADKPNKWYGIPEERILAIWDNENKRATTLGHRYHAYREENILNKGEVDGIPVIRSKMLNGVKLAPVQKLTDGVYPEHLCYLASAGVCGQADIVEVRNGVLNIRDYKTSKEITMKGYYGWNKKEEKMMNKKMLPPIAHLDDCHATHYAIQLSLYMYTILRHNSQLVPGTMTIDHIKFEEDGRDQWDYPITKMDERGNPIMKEIIPITLPYLKTDIEKLLEYVKKNRNKIVKH